MNAHGEGDILSLFLKKKKVTLCDLSPIQSHFIIGAINRMYTCAFSESLNIPIHTLFSSTTYEKKKH